MTKAMLPTHCKDKDADPPHYASFVLRCWTSGGQVRARLIDVLSGASYPVADLQELPSLVERLVAKSFALDSSPPTRTS
jgi:hypothetical protein